jgi:dTDP-glucose 4,6-dehydratase
MTFEQGIDRTVQWYLDNAAWVQAVSNPEHQEWLKNNYQKQGRTL